MAAESAPRAKVFRLRGIPNHFDRLDVAKALSVFLPDGNPQDINIASLAPSCDIWSLLETKTATLTFSKLPSVVCLSPHAKEWDLPLTGPIRPMVLDDGFYGLTPLNTPLGDHGYDCIVISGLASHPMGSWQPRGPDRSFMWVRDALPTMIAGVRFLLYGYDTSLIGSRSFQTVSDLALALMNTLMDGDWILPAGKPLVFLAHSLGGVVLKQVFVMLANSNGAREKEILRKTRGVIFFGVPSRGMPVSDLLAMLGTQPNKAALVTSISDHSEFLPQLERQVEGVSFVRKMKLFWAYETQTTPTVIEVNGQYKRSGPESVLVTKESATGGRHESDPTSTIHIDANHSDMAKLTPGHHILPLIARKLHEIIQHKEGSISATATNDKYPNPLNIADPASLVDHLTTSSVGAIMEQLPNAMFNPDFWDRQSIIRSLHPPDRESRLQQIDERAGHSLEWVFDRPSIGLTPWLNNGNGVFWIRGRPGSGKSTMMKFLHNDPRTHQAMEKWPNPGKQIHASFFFHHRGTVAQKSFQGLIRSILSQITEREPMAVDMILPVFQDRYRSLLEAEKLGSLHHDLTWLIITGGLPTGHSIQTELQEILKCELPRARFREIVKHSGLPTRGDESYWLDAEKMAMESRPVLLNATEEEARFNYHEMSKTEWDEEVKSRFCSSMLEWRDTINLSRKLRDFVNRNLPRVDNPAGLEEKMNALMSMVDVVLKRQQCREFHRDFVENDEWTMPRLFSAFTSIVKQQMVDVDLCLFLDALDEYDGRLESIVEFLRDIVKPQKNSRTRIRVLFSSRPWDVFIQEFDSCAGFRIHEQTEDDVREVCAQNIKPNTPGCKEIGQLVGEIVQRARGVFLWVRLVLIDLSALAEKYTRAGECGKSLHRKLLEVLERLPNGLVDYYQSIIDRLPKSYRWETYCILEGICRSFQSIMVDEVPLLLACSTTSRYCQLAEVAQCIPEQAVDEIEAHLRVVSGGMVEVVPDASTSMDRFAALQLLHQTVLEFIKQPQFKQIILGSRSQITDENGHSFLTKQFLCRSKGDITCDILRHALESERSTGISLYSFLRDNIFTLQMFGHQISITALGVAVAGQLYLCIKDALESDSSVIGSCKDPLFQIILWALSQGLSDIDEAIALVRFLQSHGFNTSEDLQGVGGAILSGRQSKPDLTEEYFACPFWMKNPLRYSKCSGTRLTRISYVKQHLVRLHPKPIHCSRCQQHFSNLESRDNHIRNLDCVDPPKVMIEGLDDNQKAELSKRSSRFLTAKQQWFVIWCILFPGVPEPASPYASPSNYMTDYDEFYQQHYMTGYRGFCQQHGSAIIINHLRTISSWSLEDEERFRHPLMRTVLDRALWDIQHQWQEQCQQPEKQQPGNNTV